MSNTYDLDTAKALAFVYRMYLSSTKTGNVFGMRASEVVRVLKRFGYPVLTVKEQGLRKVARVTNRGAFNKKELTPESKYWIGFILADGHIKSGPSPALTIALQKRDGDHLKKLAKFLGSSRIPKLYPNRNMNTTAFHFYEGDPDIIEDLRENGITPKKSLTAKVPEHLQSSKDFWRGVIDGDGSIGETTLKRPRIRLVGTRDVCESFREFCKSIAPTRATVRPHSNIFTFELVGTSSLIVMNQLYNNSPIHLDRKFDTYNDLIRRYK